jgi:purine-binding chemotaxis protein CheW
MAEPVGHVTGFERSSLERCIAVLSAGASYGLEMSSVQEVVPVRPLTRVFHAPKELCGVMSLRGDVLPVVDLAQLLGGAATPSGLESTRIVVLRETTGKKRRLGLLVESLGGLREIPEAFLTAVPSTIPEPVRELIKGVLVDPPPCCVLDASAIFRAPALMAFGAEE